MTRLVTSCPACETRLKVTRLTCPACAMQLEGQSDIPNLLHLPSDDLEFVQVFVCYSGSLKEMAKHLGQSYPTIRNRLNGIIAKLKSGEAEREAKRHAVLDAIAKGEIKPQEGARRLKEIGV